MIVLFGSTPRKTNILLFKENQEKPTQVKNALISLIANQISRDTIVPQESHEVPDALRFLFSSPSAASPKRFQALAQLAAKLAPGTECLLKLGCSGHSHMSGLHQKVGAFHSTGTSQCREILPQQCLV